MDHRLFLGDPAGVDEGLHVGVIVGDLRELAIAQQVGTGVADVDDGDAVAQPVDAGDRGAHSGEVRIGGDDAGDLGADVGDGVAQRREHLTRRRGMHVEIGHGGDRDGAGQLAGRVAAHPVGDHEKRRAGIAGVLIALTDEADIRSGCVAQVEGHRGYFWICSVVRPTRRGAPTGRTVGDVIRVRSIQVPLVDPRSSTTQEPSAG